MSIALAGTQMAATNMATTHMAASSDSSPQSARAQPEALPAPDWTQLVNRIRDDDSAAMAELYGIFAKGIRYFLLRNLGPDDLDDKVHDCFVIVTQAIQNGELRVSPSV